MSRSLETCSRLAWQSSACVQTAVQKPAARWWYGPHPGHRQLHLDRQLALPHQFTNGAVSLGCHQTRAGLSCPVVSSSPISACQT